jgi:hypothetical protein
MKFFRESVPKYPRIKIEFFPFEDEEKKAHLYIKENMLVGWRSLGTFKTVDEATEYALAREEKLHIEEISSFDKDGKTKWPMPLKRDENVNLKKAVGEVVDIAPPGAKNMRPPKS